MRDKVIGSSVSDKIKPAVKGVLINISDGKGLGTVSNELSAVAGGVTRSASGVIAFGKADGNFQGQVGRAVTVGDGSNNDGIMDLNRDFAVLVGRNGSGIVLGDSSVASDTIENSGSSSRSKRPLTKSISSITKDGSEHGSRSRSFGLTFSRSKFFEGGNGDGTHIKIDGGISGTLNKGTDGIFKGSVTSDNDTLSLLGVRSGGTSDIKVTRGISSHGNTADETSGLNSGSTKLDAALGIYPIGGIEVQAALSAGRHAVDRSNPRGGIKTNVGEVSGSISFSGHINVKPSDSVSSKASINRNKKQNLQ